MMVRKQLYIEERQDRALKRRAKALGVTEADVLRRVLDDALKLRPAGRRELPARARALADLLSRVDEIAASTRDGGSRRRWTREELYEERENRWLR